MTNRDTEILKIEILADYYQSKFNSSISFILSVAIGFFITLITLLIQKAIGIEKYIFGIIFTIALIGFLLFGASRNYQKNLDNMDELIQQINKGEKPLPPLKQLRKKQFF